MKVTWEDSQGVLRALSSLTAQPALPGHADPPCVLTFPSRLLGLRGNAES